MFIGEKLLNRTESNVNALWTVISLFLAKSAISLGDELHLHPLISLRKITSELGNDPNLLIVFYVQIMPDDFVMQLHRF